LLLSAVTVSLPWHGLQTHHPLRAFDDRLAAVEITAFQTAPFEDALAESETIDVRRHYYKLPVKQLAAGPSDADNPSADLYPPTVAYPRESFAAAHQKSHTLVVFYHGENNKANATNTISSSCPPVVPLC
jgi:hypothetical protein